jgi:esterase/lipase superfamily enzyme
VLLIGRFPMFSILGLLLTSQFFIMSDRGNFWNPDKISKQTEIVAEKGDRNIAVHPLQFKNQKILLLVHGFDNTAAEAIDTYHLIHTQIGQLKDKNGNDLYDSVIGYLWPGYDDRLEYFDAEKNALELAQRTRTHLILLSKITKTIDILAHSMGNRLMFEALDFPPQDTMKRTIENFYSFGAAVDKDSIERYHKYDYSTENCRDLYVFHSNRDEVLKFLYRIAQWKGALGSEAPSNLTKVAKNIQLIDCTAFVTGHSQYFSALPLYKFINKQHLKELPPPDVAQNVVILKDGTIKRLSTN